ncbi:unnamed protein product [Rotaria magnacalcarata]|uniref:Uncharacterized protein n=1 Tax=Rotaria magnacalcarata TaxID=392030 RepID=A0A820D9W3_9BILA|nr:unnamed protein product [Rotaria magnacalcarata]
MWKDTESKELERWLKEAEDNIRSRFNSYRGWYRRIETISLTSDLSFSIPTEPVHYTSDAVMRKRDRLVESSYNESNILTSDILTMNHNISRTNSEDIKQLIELYGVFCLQELHFLIELNQRWSPYDPNKIQNMTVIIRETFASEHRQADVERVIKYLNSHDSVQLFSAVTVDMNLDKSDQLFHLNPCVPFVYQFLMLLWLIFYLFEYIL